MGKSLIIKGADFSANGIAPDFEELKCIVATSASQFIESPVAFTPRSRLVAEFAVSNLTNVGNIFGFSSNTTLYPEENFHFLTIVNPSYFSGSYGLLGYMNKKGAQALTTSVSDLAKHTLDVSTYALTAVSTDITISAETSTQNSVAFGIFGTSGYTSTAKDVLVGLKLYRVKLYSDYENANSLVLDCIPVKRLADNKICLYDMVSGAFLMTNDGTNPNFETLD